AGTERSHEAAGAGLVVLHGGRLPLRRRSAGPSNSAAPTRLRLGARLSWADIELRRFSDALQVLKLAYEQGQAQPERTMARAVSLWRALQYDEALRDFESASAAQPEWTNPRWVKALYSPLVVQSIDQMS